MDILQALWSLRRSTLPSWSRLSARLARCSTTWLLRRRDEGNDNDELHFLSLPHDSAEEPEMATMAPAEPERSSPQATRSTPDSRRLEHACSQGV